MRNEDATDPAPQQVSALLKYQSAIPRGDVSTNLAAASAGHHCAAVGAVT